MKNILCVKWGDKYNSYVDKLYEQIKNNCSYDFNFYCLTDNLQNQYDIHLPSFWDKHYIPEKNHFWAYRKLYMFNEDLFPQISGDEFLFFDLDILIHNSIDPLFTLEMNKPWIVKGWWNNIDICKKNYGKGISPIINSSVIRWNRGQLKPIYDDIEKNAQFIFFTYKSIDNYLHRKWYDITTDTSDMFNIFEKGTTYSWYKGNVFPDDIDEHKIRSDHMICLFNNSSDIDDKAIEKLWQQ